MIRIAVMMLLFILSVAPAGAEAPAVQIELNKLEQNGGACRAYLVLENRTGSTFDSLKLDLVMFDADGIVAKRLAVETAPLPAGKTSLKVFDIDALPCTKLGRLLLNNVMACADSSGARDGCLALISTSARGPTPFIK